MRRYAELLGEAEFDRCSILFVWWWTAGWESSSVVSCSLVDPGCWTFFACGTCVRGTQEEQLSGIRWNVVACRIAVTVCTAELRSEEEQCR